MKKLKVMSKKVKGFNLTLTLTQTDGYRDRSPRYGLVAETDEDVCFIPNVGPNYQFAEKLLETLFKNDVMPCTLEDVIEDLKIEKQI